MTTQMKVVTIQTVDGKHHRHKDVVQSGSQDGFFVVVTLTGKTTRYPVANILKVEEEAE